MAKKLTVKVSGKLLKDIQARSAEFSMSVQEYVTELLERNLYPERFPQISEDQREKIWEAMEVTLETRPSMEAACSKVPCDRACAPVETPSALESTCRAT